ncbi:MAG: DMT family transporter, partial [Candidatus Aenigmarchaeota archaeon]|nr:DMT family transporter [Candidatus Aenigmarchaeota archaeon]
MLWVIFALITPIMWALNDILDKFILTKRLRSAYTFNVLTMVFDAIPLVLIAAIFPITFIYPWSLVGFAAGILIVPELYFYNKAMVQEEASRVGALTNIDPIFVAIMGFFLLNEPLGAAKYAGIGLLVVGAVLISYERAKGKGAKRFIISPALALMIAYSVIFAFDSVISDHTLNFYDFWSFYAFG